ncbi:hypothetical protein PFISCL1PPCAC_11234, partial [Pristionchus fissidentatus]
VSWKCSRASIRRSIRRKPLAVSVILNRARACAKLPRNSYLLTPLILVNRYSPSLSGRSSAMVDHASRFA